MHGNTFKRRNKLINGSFGLDKEAIIIQSGLREIFTPYTPINEIKHFFGREEEASRFVSVINSPGQHILVYGDRGVGKTSLSKTACKMLLQGILQQGIFFEKRCDSCDTFSSIITEPLEAAGINLTLKEQTRTHNQGGGAKISAGFAKAELSSNLVTKTTTKSTINPDSPSWAAKQLQDLVGVFLIDEVDALRVKREKYKIAELIKLLSDANSKFKVVVVGIASTGEELTAGHPSSERCLKEVPLQRMCSGDIKKIVLNGMKELSLIPEDDVVDKIVDISAGYPHFTHLICLKCAELSLINRRRHITIETLKSALVEAVKESKNALQRSFDTTLRVFKKPQEYKLLLLAAAHCNAAEFRSAELKEKLLSKFGIDLDHQGLSKRLTNLVKATASGKGILVKPARGCFQFTDPRMPSFIKMALNNEE
jgi:Cdc6-like AAA superfamily ATPase